MPLQRAEAYARAGPLSSRQCVKESPMLEGCVARSRKSTAADRSLKSLTGRLLAREREISIHRVVRDKFQ